MQNCQVHSLLRQKVNFAQLREALEHAEDSVLSVGRTPADLQAPNRTPPSRPVATVKVCDEAEGLRWCLKGQIASQKGKSAFTDPLRDEATCVEGARTLASADGGGGERKEVEDVVEEFEREFVEHWWICRDVELCREVSEYCLTATKGVKGRTG
jgi:hypothetical protein